MTPGGRFEAGRDRPLDPARSFVFTASKLGMGYLPMTIPPETAEISLSGPDIGRKSAAIQSTNSGVKRGLERQLAVQYRPLSTLIPYARNARTHSERQVAEIAASIREFGWTNPILVDGDNGLIAGHGRLLAARKLGMADVPVIELAGLSEAQKRALVLADNKLALNAGWDIDLLGVELADLQSMGFDLALTGFGEEEVSSLLAGGTTGLTDPDDVPETPKQPVSRIGDLWLLGKHRLICGDSTSAADVEQVLSGVKPHLLVSDPPYGVAYDPAWRSQLPDHAGVDLARGTVLNNDRADWREAWALFPGDVIYVWHGALHAATVAESLEACGFSIRSQIVWDKTRLVIGRGDYHWQHEPCWYAVRKGKKGHWSGDRKQTTVWQITHENPRQATAPKSRSSA